jgi:hypothetical protein
MIIKEKKFQNHINDFFNNYRMIANGRTSLLTLGWADMATNQITKLLKQLEAKGQESKKQRAVKEQELHLLMKDITIDQLKDVAWKSSHVNPAEADIKYLKETWRSLYILLRDV